MTTERTLRPVITLLYVNLGVSVLLAALTFLLKDNVLGYQVQHMISSGKAHASDEATIRNVLNSTLWIRPVSVLLVSVIYVRLAARLKLGRRRTYFRLLAIGVFGLLGLAYLVATAEFPVWYRVIQIVQGLVLIGLLGILSTKNVRDHFAPKPAPAQRVA